MKRMLLVALEYPPRTGGVEEYYRGLVGASNGAIVPMSGERALLWKGWPRWLPLLWRIPREMTKQKADVVLAGEVLPIGEVLWLIGLFSFELRYGVFTHGLDLALTGRKRWIAKRVMQRATWVIANSEYTKKIVLNYEIDPKKVLVLTPCPSASVIASTAKKSASPPRNDDEWRLLTVARFVERKGYDTAVAVAAELEMRGARFQWTFIGDGPDKERIQAFAVSRGVGDRIRWLCSLPPEKLAEQYCQADCFVFLPRELPNGDVEGFGMVCLEAALFGLPVVASRSGGVPAAIVDGVTGVLTSPTDAKKIAQDIISLLGDPKQMEEMGAAGRARALKEFRWEDRVRKLFGTIG